MQEEDLRAYYREHAGNYKSSFGIRWTTYFAKKADALSALDRLRKARISAGEGERRGQVRDLSRESVLFEDILMSFDQLPPGVRDALAGAQPVSSGCMRAWRTRSISSPSRRSPPLQQEFEEVRGLIRPEVFKIKLNAAIQEWVGKLKGSADIKIYLSRSEQ